MVFFFFFNPHVATFILFLPSPLNSYIQELIPSELVQNSVTANIQLPGLRVALKRRIRQYIFPSVSEGDWVLDSQGYQNMQMLKSLILNGIVFAYNLCNPPLYFQSSLDEYLMHYKYYGNSPKYRANAM